MKVNAVFFDIAGTTVTDDGFVKLAFINAFKAFGIALKDEETDSVMGFKKIEAIKIIADEHGLSWNNQKLLEVHDRFATEMKAVYASVALQPLPGVIETFKWLQQRGIAFGFNTGFTREITDVVLAKLGWNQDNYAKAVVSSDEVIAGRPAPYMIQKLMDKLGIANVATCIKVGDTEVDVMEGKNAGCGKVVSVTTGTYSRADLEQFKPDFIIDHMQELVAIIEQYK
ncbi:MAG: HAD hydrolase-like protein [Chitinophagaceae bacterium]|nr:HAD hydrolase-like protein [Chitinophagaceae bacterium]